MDRNTVNLAYYNEPDPYAAQWLKNLINAGHIAPGYVDERDIRDVRPTDLTVFTQCHFFAGIGIWSHALRSAGWSDSQPIWTGSCPCQPFSAAGKRTGVDDERHLWPHWFWLIEQRRPPIVVGEQVASKDGLEWFDLVSSDLESANYAVGAADLCAAGIGGSHLRQRLYFVGLADGGVTSSGRDTATVSGPQDQINRIWTSNGCVTDRFVDGGTTQRLADDHDARLERYRQSGQFDDSLERSDSGRYCSESGTSGGMVQSDSDGSQPGKSTAASARLGSSTISTSGDGRNNLCDSRTTGPLDDADWLLCRNLTGEPIWRPVGPGTFPLVNETPARVGRLRAYGNALDAETAIHWCETVKGILA